VRHQAREQQQSVQTESKLTAVSDPFQEGYQHQNPEDTRLGKETTVPFQGGYKHNISEQAVFGKEMIMPFQEGYQDQIPEHTGFGKEITVTFQEGYQHQIPEHTGLGKEITVTFQERYQHQISEQTQLGKEVTVSFQGGYQNQNLEDTRLGKETTVPSQGGYKHNISEQAVIGKEMTMPFQEGYQHKQSGKKKKVRFQDECKDKIPKYSQHVKRIPLEYQKQYQHENPEHTQSGKGMKVPFQRSEQFKNPENTQLGKEVKVSEKVDVRYAEGQDQVQLECKIVLPTEESFDDDWPFHITVSGLEVYEMFKLCRNSESCSASKEQPHVRFRRTVCHIVPPILVCPMSMHTVFHCSWIGFLCDRPEHVATVHRDRLVKGTTVELGDESVAVVSAFSELFLCYTVLERGVLYCIVRHACYYISCPSHFWYITQYSDGISGEVLMKNEVVATMFQTFSFLRDAGKCVSYKEHTSNYRVKFSICPHAGLRC
jgi:hypothetical protein